MTHGRPALAATSSTPSAEQTGPRGCFEWGFDLDGMEAEVGIRSRIETRSGSTICVWKHSERMTTGIGKFEESERHRKACQASGKRSWASSVWTRPPPPPQRNLRNDSSTPQATTATRETQNCDQKGPAPASGFSKRTGATITYALLTHAIIAFTNLHDPPRSSTRRVARVPRLLTPARLVRWTHRWTVIGNADGLIRPIWKATRASCDHA